MVRKASERLPGLADVAPEDWQVHSDFAAMNAIVPLPITALMALDDASFVSALSGMASFVEQIGGLDDAGGLQ